ncbi:MFS monocarboxylate transporter [Amylocarpus encephaloides]|uniref:MFS monocarboxylate transporter n=1 Tax=Amylocarpus encephaloides TaxID=45428 RepID=A0A9P7YNE2_9HELO|nr:MFS monocarboxylate transporter [Amylocarpus encephaloides]
MTTTSNVALQELEETLQGVDRLHNPNHGPEFSLPPADSGKDAWLFLTACFILEALIWGFPFSFGVFQEYYSTHEPFSSDPSGIAVIGTTATGIMYLFAVPLAVAYNKWSWLANASKWAGIPLMASGLVAASFANNVKTLVMTQGVLYALGGAVVYSPALIFLDQWFVRRKGLAFGVMWAGTGVGGLTIPFIMNSLLSRFGFRTTLRIWAVTNLVLTSPFIYFLRPRLPVGPVSHSPRRGLNFLRTSTFWILFIGLTAESLGYFIPGIYLPSFARALGLSPAIGTLLVALINAAGVSGTVFMGWLIDRFHVATIVLICSVGAAASVFLGWGLSNALPLLCIFSILYGFFAGGYVSTNAGFLKIIKQKDQSTDVGALIGMLSAGRGLGALVSGPLSEALLRGSPWKGEADFGYGSGFGSLIVFTGVTATVGAAGFLGRRVGWV